MLSLLCRYFIGPVPNRKFQLVTGLPYLLLDLLMLVGLAAVVTLLKFIFFISSLSSRVDGVKSRKRKGLNLNVEIKTALVGICKYRYL